MPWPFAGVADRTTRERRRPRRQARPITIDDLAGPRRLVAHAGGWQSARAVERRRRPAPPRRSSARARRSSRSSRGHSRSSPTVAARGFRRTRPAGMSHGSCPCACRLLRTCRHRRIRAMSTPVTAELYADVEAARRPVVASGRARSSDLTTYAGDLVAAEPRVDAGRVREPDLCRRRDPRGATAADLQRRCWPSARGASWPSFVPTWRGDERTQGARTRDLERPAALGDGRWRSRDGSVSVRPCPPDRSTSAIPKRRTRDDRGRGVGSGDRAAEQPPSTRRARRGSPLPSRRGGPSPTTDDADVPPGCALTSTRVARSRSWTRSPSVVTRGSPDRVAHRSPSLHT